MKWINRNSKLRPGRHQQVLAQMQDRDLTSDSYVVTRYDAERDLFVGESSYRKVVRWMPILPARRVTVDWEKWAERFGG